MADINRSTISFTIVFYNTIRYGTCGTVFSNVSTAFQKTKNNYKYVCLMTFASN